VTAPVVQPECEKGKGKPERNVHSRGPQARFGSQGLQEPQCGANISPGWRRPEVTQQAADEVRDDQREQQWHGDRHPERQRPADTGSEQNFQESD
jgi:hypothetical protein